MNEIEKRFNSIQEAEPDIADLQAINRITNTNDTSDGISLGEMDVAVRDVIEVVQGAS